MQGECPLPGLRGSTLALLERIAHVPPDLVVMTTSGRESVATLARHIPVRLLVDTAPAREAVARIVKAERAGLVVAARGRAGQRAAGAAAAAIVRNTPCSVLVV